MTSLLYISQFFFVDAILHLAFIIFKLLVFVDPNAAHSLTENRPRL